MNDEEAATRSGLLVLARALASVIDADQRTTFEEKAKMITVFGKHVARGEISQGQLRAIADDAFSYADRVPLERFLDEVTPNLTVRRQNVWAT